MSEPTLWDKLALMNFFIILLIFIAIGFKLTTMTERIESVECQIQEMEQEE